MFNFGTKGKRSMFVTLSFSGGASHNSDVSKEVQETIAGKVAKAVAETLEANHMSGTGSLTVGGANVSFTASSKSTIEDEFASGPATSGPALVS